MYNEIMKNYNPKILIQYNRSDLIEQEHSGFITIFKNDFFHEIGDSADYPFYLRSCAKPLQASLIVDCGLDFSTAETAICCASHAGEPCHTALAERLLYKIGLDKSYLKCGLHKPISQSEKEKLIKSGTKETIFQNNCVGKHIMMLAICKKMSWDLKTYDEISHPLQQKIKAKIYELCEIKEEYPITKDGCGVPIHSMPLKNILKGYLNVFCNEKYSLIQTAYRNHPYIIGGENRLDTKIMQNSKNLVAKVGAGGLCCVVNLKTKEGFIVKISDCDMKAREIVVLSLLKELKWSKINCDRDIKTLHNEKIGEILTVF